MAEWQYFVQTDDPDDAEHGDAILMRLRVGDPLLAAEGVGRDGRWKNYDAIYRKRMMGSSDEEITEISVARAEGILRAWVKRGRIKRLPDPNQDDRPDEETLTRFRALEARVSAVWASVPVPPGVEQIGQPPAGDDQ